MLHEVKVDTLEMNRNIDVLTRKIETISKNKAETLDLKNTVSEIKRNSLDGLNSTHTHKNEHSPESLVRPRINRESRNRPMQIQSIVVVVAVLTKCKGTSMEKEQSFQQIVLMQLDIHSHTKVNTNIPLTPYSKINSTWVVCLNVKVN